MPRANRHDKLQACLSTTEDVMYNIIGFLGGSSSNDMDVYLEKLLSDLFDEVLSQVSVLKTMLFHYRETAEVNEQLLEEFLNKENQLRKEYEELKRKYALNR